MERHQADAPPVHLGLTGCQAHDNRLCSVWYLARRARFFNKIKQCRRVATRYDKLAAHYLAFVKLACIRLWLRVYECTA